ncbi:hypothetical protein SAMN05216475_3285 [Pseudomonas synxantha]|uniref:Uncharacterized protein n=1 Tax=Pseudomonas synxantha TaxID=47883 RepID=A0AAX3I9D3_9PSED|nr:hypothetical protein [Pseudomonas synxantha]KRP53564.1 hypothetical protein TU77_16065 [Pseudomonas synxantha]SDU43714.1 hypothetical protein SAMN05216475_3285 [Pseudomonas synxantha]VTR02132.1 Uncharacterised protein [Pseudomonas synxantha]
MNGPRMGGDPRTVAREISGVFETIFPHLIPRVVTYINRISVTIPAFETIDHKLLSESSLQKSMLFEIASGVAESSLVAGCLPSWDVLLLNAVAKQRLHYDAEIPLILAEGDKVVAKVTGENLVRGLASLAGSKSLPLSDVVIAPKIPGYGWISSGVGDFAVGDCLVEVKCSAKNFSSADYRQVLMYWLMSYLYAIETNSTEWKSCVLINPRVNKMVEVDFDELVRLVSPGGSKLQLVEKFRALIEVGLSKF